ncbi:MAG: hypothetical protein JWQ16_627 [Novosphingobium sp.]|nr:hypothetical protein [Novosphingobium sp.]
MRFRRSLIGLAVVLAACSARPDAGAKAAPSAAQTTELAVHSLSGLAVIPLTVHHGKHALRFRVEAARSPSEQERGLMFRTQMGVNEGMIFPFNPPRPAAFWMKNTVIPLDIVFIGADGRILNIAANATPYSLAPIPSAGVTAGVLELIGGRAAQLGIVAGDKVEW